MWENSIIRAKNPQFAAFSVKDRDESIIHVRNLSLWAAGTAVENLSPEGNGLKKENYRVISKSPFWNGGDELPYVIMR
jgi:hypothetical protein